MVLGMVCFDHHIGKVVAFERACRHCDSLLTEIRYGGSLGADQRGTRRAAMIERGQWAVIKGALARALGAIEARNQPRIGVEGMGTKATNGAIDIQLS